MRALLPLAFLASGVGVAACARSVPVSSPAPVVADSAATTARVRAPGDLRPGMRIRYHLRDDPLGIRMGRVARVTSDTLWLTTRRALPVARLRRLDVSRGGMPAERRLIGGALVGGAIFGVLGALASPDTANHHMPAGAGERAALFGLYGFVTGGLVGAFLPGERWEPVPLPGR